MHGLQGDGRVRAGALRRGGDVVFFAGVLSVGGAKGGVEGVVVAGIVVFVVEVEAVNGHVAEGSHV